MLFKRGTSASAVNESTPPDPNAPLMALRGARRGPALASGYLPARRAAQLDPTVALRAE